ncbi:MAG: DUF5050 domain-containing protein [Clostridia bacterium]|nr:DUF5050 domain-containing protein [Clostridia bacterium]
MKKKILATIIAVLLMCAPLTACGESFKNDAVEGVQDTSYVVVSNGGSAVQYGNYVYYINGYRGYEDSDGSENYWGNVVKGGLYRAELNAGSDVSFDYTTAFGVSVSGLKTFDGAYNVDTNYDFVTKKNTVVTGYEKDEDGNIEYDEDGNAIEITEDVTESVSYRIASKTIGTSGYSNGGIFIYDDYVYYATPSNKQNRQGEFETTKTMFFRTKLDGTGTKRLYTSENDTAAADYAFYKQDGKVYLTVLDGTSIISVRVGDKKVERVTEIATDVTDALFPVRDVYYNGIDTNQAEDFIYYTRDITEDDRIRSGNIVVAMRPSGEERAEIISNGNTVTLKNVDGGYLFYEDAQTGGNVIMYTNLHEQFMEFSLSYKSAYEANYDAIVDANGSFSAVIGHQSGVALNVENIGDYSEVVCFRPSMLSNQVYAVCFDGNGIYTYNGVEMVTVYNGSIRMIYDVIGTNVYYGDSDGGYHYTNVFVAAQDNEVVTIAQNMSTSATFGIDVVGRFAMMFGEVDDYAKDYAMFVNLDRIDEGTQFVGVKAEDDVYDPTVELEQEN